MSACSSVEVHTDYDPNLDMTHYRTYAWKQRPKTTSPLMGERLNAALDAQLESKGWKQVALGQGEVEVVGYVTAKENERIDTINSGGGPGLWGRGYWMGGGFGSSTSTVTTYLVGTLIVDLFDAKTQRPLWRGTATGTVSNDPQTNVERIQEGVQKLFLEFPPGSSSKR
jgi:hypothetical protein